MGATPQVIENLLADFLAEYERRHALVEVELKEAGGAELGNLLDRGEVDVAIMPAGDARFEGRVLYPMCLLAVLPERHRLSRRPLLEVSDLEGEPLLQLGRGFASHAWFDAACHVAHVRPRVLLRVAHRKPLLPWRGPGTELPWCLRQYASPVMGFGLCRSCIVGPR